MYRTSVPMINRTFARQDRERVASSLKKMGVSRVMLAIGAYEFDRHIFDEELAVLRDNVAFLKARGFEVGAWMWSFMVAPSSADFTRVRLLSGADSTQSVCCADESFCNFAAEYVQRVAGCGVDMVLYDDDYRLGYLGGDVGCLCEHHMAFMSEKLGEPLTHEMLVPHLTRGGANRYRSAWQASKQYYLLAFARRMREAVNKVAPTVRLGLCACFTVWDLDGVSPMKIARTLAGDTKPFLRLIGAPYWSVRRSMGGNRLQDVIEVSRMERSLFAPCDDVEIVGEGDTYPRPRWVCPSAYLEGFDTAMRADGRLDGILKYAVDYTASFDYEQGYIQKHMRNLPLYEQIDALFGGKSAVGVRVWEFMSKYEHGVVPEAVHTPKELCYTCFSYASRMLAAASIPTTYDDENCVGAVFGENARALPLTALKNGMILDVRAAEILRERGVDVGLERLGEFCNTSTEIYLDSRELVDLQGSRVRLTELKAAAREQSVFALVNTRTQLPCVWDDATTGRQAKIPGSYLYENDNGERFLVLCFEGQLASEYLLRQYARAKQLAEVLPWLGRRTFPVRIDGHPDLYVMAKREGDTMTVGLWNFSADDVETPVVTLDGEYAVTRTIACEAAADGCRVTLSRIEPYGFAAFEVKK